MSKATDYLTANNHFLLIVFTLCLSLWTAFFQTTSAVFADNLPDSEIQALNEYPNWVGGSACSTSVNTPGSSSSIDLSSIAQKYNLQSAIVEQVGGNAIGSYSSDQPPTTPASTMKLIIADVLIRSGLSLDKKITITPDMVYGPGYSAGDKPTLGDAMDQMLSVSSNTAANGLIEALGGFAGITSKANSYGYTNTNIKSYYSVAGDAVNQSTIGDEANAMNHIFTTSGGSYTEAQADLESAAKNDNFYNVSDDANKWAGTTQVAGDVAKLSSGGTDYIIGVYSNESDSQGQSSGNIKDSIAAILRTTGVRLALAVAQALVQPTLAQVHYRHLYHHHITASLLRRPTSLTLLLLYSRQYFMVVSMAIASRTRRPHTEMARLGQARPQAPKGLSSLSRKPGRNISRMAMAMASKMFRTWPMRLLARPTI
jgi:hypothetical protein